MLAMSAALACEFSRAASTVRRMRPQKSGSQLAWPPIGRDLVAAGGEVAGERGKEVGARRAYLVTRGQICFQCLAQALIVAGYAIFEAVELRVLVDLPPLVAQHAVRGRGGLPAATGWIGRRSDDRGGAGFLIDCGGLIGGAVVVGAYGLAAGEANE